MVHFCLNISPPPPPPPPPPQPVHPTPISRQVSPLAAAAAVRPSVCGRRPLTIVASAIDAAATPQASESSPPAAAKNENELPPVSAMDFRIGRILSVEKHPEADSLYIEKIDVGEEEPRTIVSGLVPYCSEEDLQDRMVAIVANLKSRNMRGVPSHGMLLCTSNDDHSAVEPLCVPANATIGERVWFGEEADGETQEEAWKENKVQKKKVWEAISADLKTDSDKVGNYQGRVMRCSAGPLTSSQFAGSSIS